MRFSIIIPVYNVEPYLRECLDSVLRQNYSDWEAICVNNGSTDGSLMILEEYASQDERFKVFSQVNGGPGAGRNTGIQEASGDYLFFLDSDDWIESNTLSILNANIDDEDMICFGGWRGDQEDRPVAAEFQTGWEYFNDSALRHRTFPFVCVVLRCYRLAFIKDKKLRFRENIFHEDNLFTPIVCLNAGRVKVIADAPYHYRLRPGSIMTTRSQRHRQDLILVSNDLAVFFTQVHGVNCSVIYRLITNCYQVAFLKATHKDDEQLRTIINWYLYRTVSRTRPRHRVNYFLIRFLPTLFRLVNRSKC